MAGINKVILIGRLGKDPDVRHLDNGVTITKFSLATSEYYKDKDGNRVEKTDWHNIVLWRNLAEIAEKYLTKGRQIYLEGKIRTRSWDDKDGNKRYTTEIIGNSFTILDSKRKEVTEEVSQDENINTDNPESEKEGDDLPF